MTESDSCLRRLAARWARAHRARAIIKVGAFALAGALLAIAVAGRVNAQIGPFQTTVAARPSLASETTVVLAPLGSIRLDTHDWPLTLQLRVDELGLDEARRIAGDPGLIEEELGDQVADDVASAILRLALWSALLAAAGGAIGALVARVDWRAAIGGTAAGAVLVLATGAGTALTFDTDAVSEPRYTGLLTLAPQAVGEVEEVIERFGEYRAQLSELVANVVTLYLAAEGLPTFDPADSTLRVLHVADLHLNPQAFDLMHQLVDRFDVSAIVDSGDITDWGTEPEAQFVAEIAGFDVPYVWVRGNHDSQGTQEAVAEQPNAVVLDDEAATVAGLRFWGIGDPRYTPDQTEQGPGDDHRDHADAFAPIVARQLDAAQPPPVDVAVVHDPRIAVDLGGQVPLVLAGHRHDTQEHRLGEDDETILLVEGSTGGAGLRGLQADEPQPLTASILYFHPETNRLLAYDRIALRGLGETGATIERHIIPVEDRDDNDTDENGDNDR
jgi:predicted MPP superfamily phosphohydrolase